MLLCCTHTHTHTHTHAHTHTHTHTHTYTYTHTHTYTHTRTHAHTHTRTHTHIHTHTHTHTQCTGMCECGVWGARQRNVKCVAEVDGEEVVIDSTKCNATTRPQSMEICDPCPQWVTGPFGPVSGTGTEKQWYGNRITHSLRPSSPVLHNLWPRPPPS